MQILLADQIYGSRIMIERLNEKCRGDAQGNELDAADYAGGLEWVYQLLLTLKEREDVPFCCE